MSSKELKFYLNGLPKFFEHFKKGGSLLARIYGIFKVQLKGMNPICLMVMKNSIMAKDKVPYKFDLKGSEIKRQVLPENINKVSKEAYKKLTESQVLKDIDLRTLKLRDGNLINLSLADR